MDKNSPSIVQSNTSSSAAAASPKLKAPDGWTKKLIQKTGPYGRTAVSFVSTDGVEIKSRRQMELYMKSHPGGPSVSEFSWSSDDTPRRSPRITESKADESPETETSNKKQKEVVVKEYSDIEEQKIEVEVKVEDSGDYRRRSSRLIKSSPAETPKTETLKKKQKKSSSKKEVEVKKPTGKKGAKEESKGSAEVAMEAAADTEQKVNQGHGLKAEEAVAGGSELKEAEQKSDQVEDVNKASAAEEYEN